MPDYSELERIADERRTIMNEPDKTPEDIQEYERLGEEYSQEVDKLYPK